MAPSNWVSSTSATRETGMSASGTPKSPSGPSRGSPTGTTIGILNLTEDGSLVLSYGNSVIWATNATRKASSALITDAGNLIVYGADNKSEITWQSFDNQGNTLLPGMKMSGSRKLTAWKSPWDPSTGQYNFQMDPDRANQLVLMRGSSEKYWESGVWNDGFFSNVPEMKGPHKYDFIFFDNGTYKYFTFYVKETANILARFVLSENGIIELSTILKTRDEWNSFWMQPLDQCQVYALCGPYASCRRDNVQFCNCLEGFTPADSLMWQAKVSYGGCVRQTALDCQAGGNRTTDGFIELTGKETPPGAVDSTAENCREECLRNCSCTAYADVGDLTCRRWFSDLINLKDASAGTTENLFVRVAAADVLKRESKKTNVVGAAGGAAAVLALLVTVIVLFCFFCRHRQRPRESSEHQPALLTVFSYRELRVITKNFSERLGGGGFGSVFKGILPDKSHVAVKKMEGSRQGEKQFRAEVSTTGIIQHVNLIRLRGFCSEGSHRLLVYDLMPNGSLDSFLFPKSGKESSTLDWKTRFDIAVGTARGILYLHENCRDYIIHCDIKPENILLDSDFCPKVSDFGLAKLVGREFSRVLTTVRGTRGYLAPEWVSGLPITPKADVYSFGMTLLEIIAGRRNMGIHLESSGVFFPTWAASQINAGNTEALLDKALHKNADAEQVKRAAMVVGWCIQDDEDARPSMKQVVQMLEGNEDVAVPPVPMSLQALVSEPNSLMVDWHEETEAASLSMASAR